MMNTTIKGTLNYMEEKMSIPKNPYNNEVAIKDLLKMMKRKDLITISFVIDRHGYESLEVESKIMDRFYVQFTTGLYDCIYNYLLSGKIDTSTLSLSDVRAISSYKDTNELSTNILRIFIEEPKERPHMHVVPEVVDKPDRLTVTFAYPYGVIVFKVTRSQEMRDFLESQGF